MVFTFGFQNFFSIAARRSCCVLLFELTSLHCLKEKTECDTHLLSTAILCFRGNVYFTAKLCHFQRLYSNFYFLLLFFLDRCIEERTNERPAGGDNPAQSSNHIRYHALDVFMHFNRTSNLQGSCSRQQAAGSRQLSRRFI